VPSETLHWVISARVDICLCIFLARKEALEPILSGKGERFVIHAFHGVYWFVIHAFHVSKIQFKYRKHINYFTLNFFTFMEYIITDI
jgi:hypothetical protein